ncbi:MAG: alpha-mannosidase [Herpetosiphonaceae bacterium]|nr:alpha-mannosidase [Herpetosiphonaceae bacterium]
MLHTTRWTAQKIAQRLELIAPLVYRRSHTLAPFRYHPLASPLEPPLVGQKVDDSDWQVIEPYTYWGTWRTDFMLRSSFDVPGDWDQALPVALYLPIGDAGEFVHPEALAYIDGASYAACDRYHQEILLPALVHDGHSHQLDLHGWTGNGGWQVGTKLLMRPCMVVQIDQPTRDFITTVRVALGVSNTLSPSEPARGHLLNGLDDAFKLLDTREPFGDEFYESVPQAHAALRAGIEQAGRPLDVQVVASGHAHIDVAWLWPLGQTRRKAGRTFHTVLRLMEQFPEYHFTQSQPQLYEFVRQDYPELFGAIKQRVAEGRWEITGDMWIEADCNLSGGESLARQFLLGRTFFREHFGLGISSRVLWLPDVFGYAWALPQLLKQADIDYFFTIKIGWSQYNRLPYDSFWWQGLDGTRVLTHFSPTPEHGSAYASTYNAKAEPDDVIGTWTNFRQKDLVGKAGDPLPPLLMAFGYGDGGGGPTREMLENLRAMEEFPATPRITQKHVGEFFQDLERTAGERLPVWNGELYLEYHRGTYTTQSRNKRANRKSEFMLHDAEFLATLAMLNDPDYGYPTETFRNLWRLICLNQFHDIIPGSSINQVYVESQLQYTQIKEQADTVRHEALQALAGRMTGDLLIANPTSFMRHDLAVWQGELPAGQHLQRADGSSVAAQATDGAVLLDLHNVAPLSVVALHFAAGDAPTTAGRLVATPALLENDFLRVELDGAGDITRIFDKQAAREVLVGGTIANQFQAFEDRPMSWDAWDVDIFFDDKQWTAEPASSVRVIEAGPLRAVIEVRRRILHSSYVQRISLTATSARLDFDTTIDWRERHVLLKVAFPVDILAPVATYEIQWGNVQRPTHHNTSWDWARFETCAHKWIDLSEGDYGVSLLNDCKYGHDVRNNVMRISLLRSPTMPDPEADQGEQRFAYSLLPHAGTWDETTISAAYALNDPLIVADMRALRPAETLDRSQDTIEMSLSTGLITCDQPSIVVETIKRAEDGRGIIVRCYESQRRRGSITLTMGCSLTKAWRSNLLEEDQEEVAVHDDRITFGVRPYEIFTLRLVPAAQA